MRDDAERFLQAADVFLFPSRREGFGTAIIEAMACGLPCVVAELPGITDFIFPKPPDGAGGVVVPQEDPAALADAALALLAVPERARALGAAARARAAERFGIDAVAEQYLSLYAALLGPGRGRAPLKSSTSPRTSLCRRRTGGAVHVREVAGGLAALGHSVHAVVKGLPGEQARSVEAGFEVRRVLHHVPPRMLRLLALPAVAREARELEPDVVIERYYNFGGEGVLCAARRGIPAVLEVNSPMVEYAGSPKERLDRLIGSPLRRWREHLARSAVVFVTPTAAILPEFVPAEKVHVLPWGANTDRFRPDVEPAAIAPACGTARRRVRRQLSAVARRAHAGRGGHGASAPGPPRSGSS